MTTQVPDRRFQKFCNSKKALAIPVTFLILFVSTLGLVSITYYYAIDRIKARSQSIKVSMARENMLSLDENLLTVLWQPSSSRTYEFDDCDGELRIQPSTNPLVINITDNNDIHATIFNTTVGDVIYELPYSESPDTGLFLKGDNHPIVSQSGSAMTQLYVRSGLEHSEILLRYRPIISYVASGTENNKAVNNVRIYVVNLNLSQVIELGGKIPLKITCSTIENLVTTYDVSYQPETLLVAANLDGANGQISIPISSTSYGAIIYVRVVECRIQLDRWVR